MDQAARATPPDQYSARKQGAVVAPTASVSTVGPRVVACPYCESHPPLEVFHRWELQTFEPLRYCQQCLGFWAARDSLARGVADPYQEHPALRAVPAPVRCRACAGRLKEDEACRSCGRKAPRLRCPSCGEAMERSRQHGVLVDLCAPCQGAWFDTGEISRVYDVQPLQGLAASTVDEHATDDEPPGWLVALQVLSHLILGF